MSELPPLAPIIKRQDTGAVSNAALRSPVFADEPPSPQGAAGSVTVHAASGYFSPQASTPSPSGILLNKGEGASASSAAAPKSGDASSPGLAPPTGQAHPELHSPTAHHPLPAAHAFLRVASPDGSASESGFSSDGGGPASTAPSSAGSPPAHAKPSLSTLLTGGATTPAAAVAVAGDAGDDSALKRAASPPSPHCHFAPLPKVESDRPGTRRNSFANRVKPYVPRPVERTDTAGSAAVADDDDSHPQSPPGIYSPGDSSIPSASALSQRLSSSLTFAERTRPSAGAQHPSQQHLGSSSSPSRPTSRRSSSSRRSRSPSPPGGLRYRSPTGHGHASRSHSPNLSRHASTDALSLHYIEGEQRTAHSLSRTSSRAGSERGGGGPAVEWQIGGGAPADERQGGGAGGHGSRRASADRAGSHSLSRAASASTAGTGAGTSASGAFVDRDKEADVHRLQDKAAHGNVDAERAVSPALAAQAKRERSGSRGADGAGGAEGRPHVLKRKGSSEEVVEVRPGEEKDAQDGGELEEVAEEPEEEEEAENGDDDEDDDDDNERDDEDDDEDDDEEEDEEADRSRDQDDDDEDEEVPHDDERKTSKGAAVEVVRWHRPERDQEREQQTSPSLRVPSPSGQA
ncbi:hypothetical protein Rhopal_001383-T1 [Rhodotorula paludigena]|uniref:Proteophosphoglycan ppg4 n=1 Tax=Rhodotorula paludigena TaxID=86838 RepID=A0AAV5GH68_9BASI|nr:hypothetical protein Rhopal_001383-T1 [Rhodotorula paludigena]